MLLDLIGAPDPTFYNYFEDTVKWYSLLVEAEKSLGKMRKLERYSYGKPEHIYFQPYSVQAGIEDDHIPFMKRSEDIFNLLRCIQY